MITTMYQLYCVQCKVASLVIETFVYIIISKAKKQSVCIQYFIVTLC